MSRIGKHPIVIPAGVTVTIDGNTVNVKGPRGELTRTLHPEMKVAMEDGQVTFSWKGYSDEKKMQMTATAGFWA